MACILQSIGSCTSQSLGLYPLREDVCVREDIVRSLDSSASQRDAEQFLWSVGAGPFCEVLIRDQRLEVAGYQQKRWRCHILQLLHPPGMQSMKSNNAYALIA